MLSFFIKAVKRVMALNPCVSAVSCMVCSSVGSTEGTNSHTAVCRRVCNGLRTVSAG